MRPDGFWIKYFLTRSLHAFLILAEKRDEKRNCNMRYFGFLGEQALPALESKFWDSVWRLRGFSPHTPSWIASKRLRRKGGYPIRFGGVNRLTNCLLAYMIKITQPCVRGIYKGRKPGAAQPLNWQTGGGELLHDAAYLKTNSVLL